MGWTPTKKGGRSKYVQISYARWYVTSRNQLGGHRLNHHFDPVVKASRVWRRDSRKVKKFMEELMCRWHILSARPPWLTGLPRWYGKHDHAQRYYCGRGERVVQWRQESPEATLAIPSICEQHFHHAVVAILSWIISSLLFRSPHICSACRSRSSPWFSSVRRHLAARGLCHTIAIWSCLLFVTSLCLSLLASIPHVAFPMIERFSAGFKPHWRFNHFGLFLVSWDDFSLSNGHHDAFPASCEGSKHWTEGPQGFKIPILL